MFQAARNNLLSKKVEMRYADAQVDVRFVAVNADEDLSPVGPFIKEQGWKNQGYFEAGLARLLVVSQIPTVLVIDPNGQISSRMIGRPGALRTDVDRTNRRNAQANDLVNQQTEVY